MGCGRFPPTGGSANHMAEPHFAVTIEFARNYGQENRGSAKSCGTPPLGKTTPPVETGTKVGGHLAANFSTHNSFVLLMLEHSSKVGGQLARTPFELIVPSSFRPVFP